MGIIENIENALEELGQVDLSGVNLESGDPQLLNVLEFDLDKHVAMQPVAIGYYGNLKREAQRRLAGLKRDRERWEVKEKAKARAALSSTPNSKPTLDAINARFIIDCSAELEAWDEKIDQATQASDTLDAWYEAWKQKGFSLREYAELNESERKTPAFLKGPEDLPVVPRGISSDKGEKEKRKNEAREMIRRNRERLEKSE